MLPVFRKIRRQLLTRNAFSRYLLYAIGEILLVVIGILLALRVNNYNEAQKIKTQKDAMLRQVADDLRRNIGDLRRDKALHLLGLQSNMRVMKHLEGGLPYDPQLAFDFYYLKKDEYTNPPTTGYENLKSLGLDNVDDPQIQNLLKSIYEYLYPRLSKEFQLYPDMDAYFSDYYLDHFEPLSDTDLTHSMILASDTIPFPVTQTFEGVQITRHVGFVPLDYAALTRDPRFRSMLRESLDYRLYKLSRYGNVLLLTENVLQLIEKEAGNPEGI